MATGGIANQRESAVTKAEDLVDAASDELYLDSDVSADNESWHKIAFRPEATKVGLPELQDQAEFRGGYQMVKPKELKS